MTRNLAGSAPFLRPLSEMPDYRVAEGYPDVRGYDVCEESGEVVGRVRDLLVDPAAESVRCLVARLNDDAPGTVPTGGGEVVLPIDTVGIEEDAEIVRLRRPLARLLERQAGEASEEVEMARKPEEQPIVRGPAVQGHGTSDRRETSEAGQKGARVVSGLGAVGPGEPRRPEDEAAARTDAPPPRGSAPRR